MDDKLNKIEDNKLIYRYLSSKIEYKYSNRLDSTIFSQKRKLFDICQSNLVNIDLLITYINQHEESGVLDYLINIMHKSFLNESFFYLNQIITMLTYKKYTVPIEQYIIDKCITQIKFSVRISLYLNSFPKSKMYSMKFNIEEAMRKSYSKNVQDSELIVRQKIGENDFIVGDCNKKEEEIFYYYKCLEFFENLNKLCILLFNYPPNSINGKLSRNKVLKEFINLINEEINTMIAEEYKKYRAHKDNTSSEYKKEQLLNKGYLLPFNSDFSNQDEHSFLIVNILPSQSCCFNTKMRVPVKLTCECIELGEAEEFFELYDNKSFFDKNNTNSSSIHSSCCDFLTKQLSMFDNKNLKIFDKWKDIEKYISMSKEDIKEEKANTIDEIIKEKSSIEFDDFVVLDYDIEKINPFGEPKEKTFEKILSKSSFKRFKTYRVKCFIAKANDDLLQEMFALQLVKKFEEILGKAEIFIKSYEVIITSQTSGLIEFLNNSCSIDDILKSIPSEWNLNKFYRNFFKGNSFKNAQKAFANSLAGFCLLSYYLEIKDRHNGNIMIDNKGHIFHIDFGFLLGTSPKNLRFERAQFKLTKDYVDILDGLDGDMFKYFKSQMVKGLIVCKKYFEIISTMIKIMSHMNLACLEGQDINYIIDNLHKKFLFCYSEKQVENFVDEMIKNNYENFWTKKYDMYQYWTNGILY